MTTSTETNIDISTFKYIISKVEDLVTLLDESISISAGTSDFDHGFKGVTLSFALRNGYSEIVFGRNTSSINYYKNSRIILKKVEFNHTPISEPGDTNRSFDLAFKTILSTDKQNKPVDSAIEQELKLI